MPPGVAEQIIPLKRNHPSLVLWCGGNELQAGSEQPLNDDAPVLAALKATVARLDPDRLWLPTSPTGRVFGNSLELIARDPLALHDVHGPWEYQGVTRHYALYNQGASLLHSELGVEGMTNLKTLNTVVAPEHQWPVSLDNVMWYHLGAWWVKRPMWDQVFGEMPDVETMVRATQFIQADGLRYAVEADRRRSITTAEPCPGNSTSHTRWRRVRQPWTIMLSLNRPIMPSRAPMRRFTFRPISPRWLGRIVCCLKPMCGPTTRVSKNSLMPS